MKLENQSFDKKLAELKMLIATTQSEIMAVEKEKEAYIKNLGKRKQELLENSVVLSEAHVEVHDGMIFLVFKDKDFEYVARLTEEQAGHFADELDDELNKITENKFDFKLSDSLMNDIFKSIVKPANLYATK